MARIYGFTAPFFSSRHTERAVLEKLQRNTSVWQRIGLTVCT